MMSGNKNFLEDSFIILEEARKNADELKMAIEEFLDKKPFRLVEHNSERLQTIGVEQKIKTPNEIKVLLNSFLNNCRSSLEYLAIALVSANNGDINCKDIQFPTAKNRDSFLTNLYGKPPKKVSAKQKAISPKPKTGIMLASGRAIAKLADGEFYEGGKGASIRGLHDLNNVTKHRRLIPSYSTVTLKNLNVCGLTIKSFTGASNSDGKALKVANIGAPRNSMGECQSITEPKLQFDDDVVFDIKIAGPECFSTQSLAIVIDNIYKDTHDLVDSFKEDF